MRFDDIVRRMLARRTPLPSLLSAARFVLPALLACTLSGCQPTEQPGAAPLLPERGNKSSNRPAAVLQARIFQVQDGDSFIAKLDDGGRRTIRLSGIDAPERSQPYADRSRQNLRRLLEGRNLELQVVKVDQYGRAVALVLVDDAGGKRVDVGLAQIEAGLAWFYRRYQRDLPTASRGQYEEAEQSAKAAASGLWRAADPEPPWEFRRRQQSLRPEAGR